MEHVIRLIAGDWSGDGHDITTTVMIKSNLQRPDLKDAYSKGSLQIGFDMCSKLCEELEDNKIPDDVIKLFNGQGIDVTFDDEWNEKDNILSVEDFILLYLKVVELGNPDFKYEFITGKDINIGGYGLFLM